MDVEAVVHIGQPKAGSTSIQKTLLGATEALEAQGTFYVGLMCERAPGARRPWQHPEGWPDLTALGDARAGEELAEVVVESVGDLSERGYRRVIWSNETMLGSHSIVFPAFKGLLASGATIRVVAYIRRPDAWAQSAYLQWGIKHKGRVGPIQPFREWLAGRHMRLARDLKTWLGFGDLEVLVRNFDACPDVVADFLDCCDLEPTGIEVDRSNETPNGAVMALWALYNGQFDDPVMPEELGVYLRRSGLLDRPPRDVDVSSLVWTPDDIALLWEQSRSAREEINLIFRESGQPELPAEQPPVKPFEATQSQINAALLLLIKHQDDQIETLRRQLRRLRQDRS